MWKCHRQLISWHVDNFDGKTPYLWSKRRNSCLGDDMVSPQLLRLWKPDDTALSRSGFMPTRWRSSPAGCGDLPRNTRFFPPASTSYHQSPHRNGFRSDLVPLVLPISSSSLSWSLNIFQVTHYVIFPLASTNNTFYVYGAIHFNRSRRKLSCWKLTILWRNCWWWRRSF